MTAGRTTVLISSTILIGLGCKPTSPKAPIAPPGNSTSPASSFVRSDEKFTGPPTAFAMETLGGDELMLRVAIVAQAPTSGWTLVVDGAERQFNAIDVFATFRPPSPDEMVAHVVTPIQAAHLEGYQTTGQVTVYARMEGERTYKLVGKKPDL